MTVYLRHCSLLLSFLLITTTAQATQDPDGGSPEVNSETSESPEIERTEDAEASNGVAEDVDKKEQGDTQNEAETETSPTDSSHEASDNEIEVDGQTPQTELPQSGVGSRDDGATDDSSSPEESADRPSEDIVIIDLETSSPEAPAAPDTETVIILDEDEADSSASDVLIVTDASDLSTGQEVFEPIGRFRGEYRTRGLWDMVHDGDAEDVFEWWQTLNLFLKYQFAEAWDVVSEIDTRYGVIGESPQESAFWGLNVSYSKWLADVDLRQGYLRWRDQNWEVAFGSRVFVWGKNELFASADFLNPVNAQGDVIGLLSDPRLAKKPIWAIDASYQFGDSVFQLVVVPVFERSDIPIVGRDLALAPPGSDLEAQIRTAASLHPSIEDQIGDGFDGTEVPEESLWNSSIAFRSSTNLGGWDFAATIGWIWDRSPTIYLDDDLRGLLASGVNLLGANAGGNLSPEATAQLAAVQQKAAIGQELFRATYRRQWVAALEGEGILGPLVVRWDLGWKDGELAYTEDLESYRLMLLSGTFGLEYSYGESFFGQLSVFSQFGFDAPGQALLGWDDGELDPGDEGRTATLVGGGLVMRGSPEDVDWDWSTRTVMAIFPLSVANVAEVGYLGFENQRLALGGLLIHGERGALGDQFSRLNLVYGMYSIAF